MTTDWLPSLDKSPSRSLQARLLAALARDIDQGRLLPGTRLPPQRELAWRLGISLGTVTKVYAEAERRGLVDAHVGRGSFIAGGESALGAEPTLIDLGLNLPPPGIAAAQLDEALARLRRRKERSELIAYAPPLGFERHRRIAAAGLSALGLGAVDWRDLVITGGAQHAMGLAFAALAKPGDTMLVEAATYHGVKSLAEHGGYRLKGLAMDGEGLLPAALDAAARPGAVLYTMPTLQNPTARSMGRERRAAITEIARRRELWIVEDDIYGALAPPGRALPPLARLLPERCLYVNSVSKLLVPGLRTGFLVLPRGATALRDRIARAIQATAIAVPALGPAIATQWLEDGTAAQMIEATRREAAARLALAREILGPARVAADAPPTLHLWLDLSELEAERVAGRALRDGVAVTPPNAPIVDGALISGLRVCIGAAADRATLRRALEVLAAALAASAEPRLVL